MATYSFRKNYKNYAKVGDVLEGTSDANGVVFIKKGKSMNTRFVVPRSEIGNTIEQIRSSKPPLPPTTGTTTTGAGITGSNTTTESKSLFTTKNIVIGVAILAIAYFGYTKFIKKGKK